LKTFKLISSRNSISSPIILISVEKAPYILFRFIPTSTYKENNFAEVSSGKVDIKILEDTKQLSSLYSFISEILKIVPENRIADFVNEYYFQEFSKLDLHSMETLIEHFQNVSIKKQLLSLYLKKFSKNKHSQELVTKLVNQDGVKPYYEFLKKSGYIKIPNFGTFEITDIDKLKQKINEFFKTFDFSIFSKGGNFSYKIDYPNSPKNRNVIIDYYLDDQKMFSINALAHCKMYAKKREKGHRYKGFFIFTTVVYDSMFEIKQYECKLFQKDIDKITTIFSLLESRLCKNKTVQLKSKWNFSVKKWLYDISAKQTAFGKLMSDAFSGGSGEAGCYEVYNECKKNCKLKNDKNGFFIFTSSDKDKCENYCIDAKISCEKGRKQEMRENICRAKCVGYNNGNGGFFSSSDYEKCMHRCLK
jgi:nucleoid DNA-binding protein